MSENANPDSWVRITIGWSCCLAHPYRSDSQLWRRCIVFRVHCGLSQLLAIFDGRDTGMVWQSGRLEDSKRDMLLLQRILKIGHEG